MRFKKKKELVSAEKLTEAWLGRLGYEPRDYGVFEMWDRLMGAQASKAVAVGLKGRKLMVDVDSSARMHDITLRKRQLLQKLNQAFGGRRPISDIIPRLARTQTEK